VNLALLRLNQQLRQPPRLPPRSRMRFRSLCLCQCHSQPSAFTNKKQAAFKASLARAAGVASETVVINKIESIISHRHLLAEAISVDTSIMAPGQAAAEEMAGRLRADSINRELYKAGLPTASSRLPNPLLTHQPLHQNYLLQIQVLVPLWRRLQWHPSPWQHLHMCV
jgi:hypothetical protein